MSSTTTQATQKYLPSMATPSLRAVMDTYRAEPVGHNDERQRVPGGYSYLITKLHAFGSKGDRADPDIVDKEIGTEAWLSSTGAKLRMRYEVNWDDEGLPTNPIDSDTVAEIQELLDQVGLVDAAVSQVSVMFWDETLGELAGNDEGLWHMNLQSDYVDGDRDREEIEKHNENMALIEQEGFKYRVLNCRRLIDRRQELNEPKAKQRPAIVWNGDTFDGLRNELHIDARRIVNHHMGEYGIGKRYGPGEEDSIVLLSVESAGEAEGVAA